MKTNNKWASLSMADKGALIKIYADNGITDLSEIKKHYNSFDDGELKSIAHIYDGETEDSQQMEAYSKNDHIPMLVDKDGNLMDFIQPSIVSANAPDIDTNNGKFAAKNMAKRIVSGLDNTGTVPNKYRNYIDGELRGAIPMRNYLDKTGTKIIHAIDDVTAWIPGPIGTVNWIGHLGADALSGNWRKVGLDLGMAALMAGAGKVASGALKRIKGEHIDDVLHEIKDKFGADSDIYKSALSTNKKFSISNKPGYYDNTIYYNPFTRKTSLAHEFGHSVGDKLESNGFGNIFLSNYKYGNTGFIDNIDIVPREAFADLFREIVHPYRGINNELKNRSNIIKDYLSKYRQNWSNWSKAPERVPNSLVKEYRALENIEALKQSNFFEKANEIGLDPRALIQMKSKNFLKNYSPEIYYHGSPYMNATEFPSPSGKNYRGKVKGTGTFEEGIYVTKNKGYADRYTAPGIGLYIGPSTGRVYPVAIKSNPIDILDPRISNWRYDSFQHLSTGQRNHIESLGYDSIIDKKGITRFNKDFDETLLFEPGQIKSLEGNIGYFYPKNSNMYYSLGGPLYNKNNPIESFSGDYILPSVRYDDGGEKPTIDLYED